jgi:hypothetical protein
MTNSTYREITSIGAGYRLDGKGDARVSYLICDKRKGSPKIHVEVCRRKCKLIQECKTYKEFVDSLEKKAA